MKIAIDISQICYPGTGVANYTSLLVENLLKIDQTNEYLLIGASFRQMDKLSDFFNYCKKINHSLQRKFFFIPQTFNNVINNKLHIPILDLFLENIDIFHTSDWIEPKTRIKKVTTVHDLVILKYPQISHPYIISTQQKRLNWIKNESSLVFTDSKSTKNDLLKFIKLEEEKVVVVYPGIEDIYKDVNGEELNRIRSKYNLLDDYILAVGTLEPRKNLNRVMAAFEKFQSHQLVKAYSKPIRLLIAGKSGWGGKMKAVKGVSFLGMVEKIDLPALYKGSRFFIYPSLYEGFGLPVLEAQASGTPVITSDRGSLQEIAATSGVLVDPESVDDIAVKMVKLFFDKDLQKTIIERGLSNAKLFNWQKTAKLVLGYYQKVDKEI